VFGRVDLRRARGVGDSRCDFDIDGGHHLDLVTDRAGRQDDRLGPMASRTCPSALRMSLAMYL
jgi:hypothetical protein